MQYLKVKEAGRNCLKPFWRWIWKDWNLCPSRNNSYGL